MSYSPFRGASQRQSLWLLQVQIRDAGGLAPRCCPLPSLAQLLNYAYAPPVRRIAFEDSNFLVVNKPFDLQVDGARPLTLEKMIREARC